MIIAHKLIAYLEHLESPHGEDKTYVSAMKASVFIAASIRKAGKFALGAYAGDELNVLTATGADQLEEGILAMPYPYTYWEQTITGKLESTGELITSTILAIGVPYIDYLRAMAPEIGSVSKEVVVDTIHERNPDIDVDTAVSIFLYNKQNFEVLPNFLTLAMVGNKVQSFSAENPIAENPSTDVEVGYQAINLTWNCVGILQALLGAKGVDIVKEEAPAKLNKIRISRGRVPIYSHHIIKIGGISSCGNIVGVGMERASPRKHWRRGHVRVYRRGEDNELKTVIPACLINGRGFVSKEYSV